MRHNHVVTIGKAVRKIAKLRGGGSALPGLVVEKLDSQFVSRTLAKLPRGVVVISGTNGKTTTVKIVTQLLESVGLKVFTNRTGSNFTRGVAAALVAEADLAGQIDADIAVLELDEAHATHFIRTVQPRYSLLLNVMRDQMDRFGEIDHTAKLLTQIATATTDTVVVNANDPLVSAVADKAANTKNIRFFGFSPELASTFPSDHDLYAQNHSKTATSSDKNTVILQSLQKNSAVFSFDGKVQAAARLQLPGIYNALNAAAALSLVRSIIGHKNDTELLAELAKIQPAFGRGESVKINGSELEIVLVKNPAGFRLALASYDDKPADTMIAINDNYADGRDMSWLWDVDFTTLSKTGVVAVGGVRAYDMALRLQYDDVTVKLVDQSLARSLEYLLRNHSDRPMRVFCTYTAMLKIRKLLAKHTDLEAIE